MHQASLAHLVNEVVVNHGDEHLQQQQQQQQDVSNRKQHHSEHPHNTLTRRNVRRWLCKVMLIKHIRPTFSTCDSCILAGHQCKQAAVAMVKLLLPYYVITVM
jgi:hypothetical protein